MTDLSDVLARMLPCDCLDGTCISARLALATPEGKALTALVDAALAWDKATSEWASMADNESCQHAAWAVHTAAKYFREVTS